MGEMKKYFEEQMEDVNESNPDNEHRTIIHNVDSGHSAENIGPNDLMAQFIYHSAEQILDEPPEVVNDGPNCTRINFHQEQVVEMTKFITGARKMSTDEQNRAGLKALLEAMIAIL